ncbi:PP2C family protein-serine/threonine phosphatase [Nonomuraea gerenzanensis]|uniref:Serine phosphatase RsbU, regulator of sigma subunit n=1 Tax=Nonomuraea gerenzanensis TaxID=93944 RepID=A0A1M4ED07_9ACTN|nr:PP2C family protein-serine/threonine phosphatase [Nonomuraea gerenzanensis]UBU18616.1 serine/threonine-protein phosphatase [Nonomuraea gerenzanensis]SBO96463.1 Serine phosphatase RsbU, regulator of sigma subunit [Nonomuraea gerenzanensis]
MDVTGEGEPVGGDNERALSGLLQAMHLAGMEKLAAQAVAHARLAGFPHVVIYVTDLQQQLLVPLPGQRDAAGEPLEVMRIDGSLPGRAFRAVTIVRARSPQRPQEHRHGHGREPAPLLWLPLLDGTERVGVMGLTTPGDAPGDEPMDEAVAEARAKDLASLVALLVISKRPHSDSFSRLVRTRPLTLSAEVLWNLLPPGTFANDDVVVSAALEPAYEMGGDAFDYALDGDLLNLSIFDAMGHDTSAGLTASIAVAACRNSRVQGLDLATTGEVIDEAIRGEFTGRFATGILARLCLGTGLLTWVNRGHHPPLVLREGRLVATLQSVPDPPMGFGLDASTGQQQYQLEPGDRLLFYTDGIIEAQSPGGELFGLERFIDFVLRQEAGGMSAPETLRRLIQAILAHQRGRLQDDATVVTVEWQTRRRFQLVL